jgi:hypothetical protein
MAKTKRKQSTFERLRSGELNRKQRRNLARRLAVTVYGRRHTGPKRGSSQRTARSNSHHGERSGCGHSKSTPKLYGVREDLFAKCRRRAAFFAPSPSSYAMTRRASRAKRLVRRATDGPAPRDSLDSSP